MIFLVQNEDGRPSNTQNMNSTCILKRKKKIIASKGLLINYFCTKNQLKEIEDNEQIAINYCNKDGKTEEEFNPNGSIKNIAGIFNKEKNVLGMMPHPERMIHTSLSGEDGSLFFNNLINNLK